MSILKSLRIVGIAEGISFLVLLGIAMPLKYLADMPMAVKVTGWIHGALFILFLGLAWAVMDKYRQSFLWLGTGFVASLIPFGTFFWDRKLKQLEEQPTS